MLEHVAEQATGVRFAFMGIAGSTAAAVGAASAMSFAFAGTAYRLNALKTATGLSFNELRGLESLAPRIGVSVEALDSGFEILGGPYGAAPSQWPGRNCRHGGNDVSKR